MTMLLLKTQKHNERLAHTIINPENRTQTAYAVTTQDATAAQTPSAQETAIRRAQRTNNAPQRHKPNQVAIGYKLRVP